MKKLKLFFALFAMLALGVTNAWAEEVSIDFSQKGYSNQEAITDATITEGINVKFDKGSNSNSPKYYTSGTAIRAYGGNTFTISSTIGNITQIDLTFGSSDGSNAITTDAGNFSSPTWTGDANSVKFTIGGTSGNRRIKAIQVTYTPSSGGGENPGEGGGEALSYTWDLSKKTYSAASNTQVTWSATDVNMVADKGTAGTAPNNYLGGDANNRTSSRFYGNSILTITPEANVTITSVVFTATSTNYATALKESTWTNANASADNTTVTVTPTDGTTAISAIIGGTCGFTGVTVHYTKAASGEPEPVIVKTLKSIAVSGMTQTYQVGDAFSFDGKCTATYSVTKDGAAQADQTAKVEPTSVSTPDMNQLGTQTVTVTYTEGEVTKTADYTITIEEAPTYDFRKIEGFDDWGSSYIEHIVEYADAKVTFASADKNGSTITDQPVTKGGDVSLVLTDGMNIATVKWVCTQWTTKAQTITLHYSKDGGNVYTSTEITSSDFTISSDNLPAGTNAVKITFSSTNQVGIKSCTITKVEAAAITQVPAPQFSLQGGAYDGAQSVELTCTMADATIHYTTDGTNPTTTSPVYSTAISVTEDMTIKAYAVKDGLEDSPVVEATYEISAVADVILDFTTNNWGLPSGSTNKVTTEASYTDGTYTVSVAGENGHYFDTDNLITGKLDAYIILPILDRPVVKVVCEGVSTGSGSVQFNLFIEDEAVSTAVTSCKVDQTFLIAEDKQAANVAHIIKVTNANNLRISKIKIYLGEAPAVEKPVIAGEEEFVTSTQVSITCTTSGAKIYYTTDGTIPTTSSTEYTAPFELSATTTVKAIAYADGQASAVATKTFTFIETITCVQAAEIALAQSANNVQTEKKYRIIAYVTETLSGVSSNQQSFKVVDNIGDESVFQSFFCNVPEEMVVGMKVEMIGKLSKYNDAAQMKNGDVTILDRPVADPKILGADAFETSTEVTITAETGMQIFYTLDGTTPTTGSTLYTAPFELSATTTVKAFAYNSATAKSSAVVEKTFTKTTIPNKTVAEFIASGGGRCYLEGVVSDIDNTQYGNFNLTDASGTIYVYGCLNANGESKKFAELGVKNGDKIKVVADTYELYQGTKNEAKNVQYVSHISAATIEVSNITMEVGETQTIAATVTPVGASVAYTIKAGSDNCITLNGAEITATEAGTATIIATIAETEDYLGITKEFTITVTAVDPKLSWTPNTVELSVGETFTAPTLNNPYNITGITYGSDNESLAAVNASTGVVSLVPDATGTATITATFAGDDTYKAVEASYTISVKPALVYGVWELVTDATSLAAGDKVVIVAKDYDFALSTNQGNNNRGQAAVIKNNNTISFSADVQVLTLEIGTVENTFALNTGKGYLYAASSGSNYLRTETTLSNNSSWAIAVSADGTATIVAKGSNTRNIMQYNQSNSLFACYGSASQKALCLYMKKNVKVEGETNNTSIPNQSDVTVDNAELNVTTEAEYDNMYIGNNGSVDVEETVTVNNLYIQTTMGTTTSGQLNTAAENIIVNGDAFIDITLGDDANPQKWHAFTVPFPVDAMNGVFDLNDKKLTNGVNYAIMQYHGDVRAQGKYGWKKYSGVLVPGTFYLMTVDGARTTYRFKKVKDAELVAKNTKSLSAYNTGGGKTTDYGWNGVGNPTLMHGKVAYNAQILDPVSYTYVLVPATSSAHFTVGTPFFIQAETDGTMTMVAETSASIAPARRAAAAVDKVKVMLGNADYTDCLYVSASEDATTEYEIGKDLAKMTMTSTPIVPQIFAQAYGTYLCMVNAPMTSNEATVALNLYAPAEGEYTLSVEEQADATVYLLYNGNIVWNLSMGEYPIQLSQGDNAGYSLVVRRENAPTDVENIFGADEQTEKFIYNGNLYILHEGKVFDAVGNVLK